jgi:hypothetical protein
MYGYQTIQKAARPFSRLFGFENKAIIFLLLKQIIYLE